MREIIADVVIIGGGAAGCYASLCLKEKGKKVILISKGLIGKSGASIFAGNLVLSGHLLGNTDEQARDTAEFLIKYHNQYLIDQDWAARCGRWIENHYYGELEEAGLYFRRDRSGEMVTSPGRIRSIAANVQGNSGVPFMDLRRKQVIRAGIERYEEAVATKLLTRADGSVGGVFVLNYLTGERFVVRARAVILATGYSDRLHFRSTGTREQSGDGIAMAWRAGAAMVNLEMQWFHTNDLAHPPTWQRVQIYPNPILGSWKSARMVNAEGEQFFDQQQDDPMAFGPYTVQLKALHRQVHAHKAHYDGQYYSGFDHMPEEEVSRYTSYLKAHDQLGIKGNELLETAVTAHYRQGGILVDNSNMRSSVPGLYVAGGLGGHSNGLIALATYDGKVVADGVTQDLPDLPSGEISEQGIADEERRLMELLHADAPNGISPREIRGQLQSCLWEKVGVEKNAAQMSEALKLVRHLRTSLLPTMHLKSKSPVANFEWLAAINVVNMLDASELIVLSSLRREESRGPFIRTDYPETDNENWLVANVIRPAGTGFRFEKIPYETPVFRPSFQRSLNLEVPW